jgi:3-hydroxy-D-aspartate aldolase
VPSWFRDADEAFVQTATAHINSMQRQLQHTPECKLITSVVLVSLQAHKCPQLAQMQLKLLGPSAVGMCCQKVTEAEAMVAGGIQDVFISNEVVAAPKITRMVALAAQGAQLLPCVSCMCCSLQSTERISEVLISISLQEGHTIVCLMALAAHKMGSRHTTVVTVASVHNIVNISNEVAAAPKIARTVALAAQGRQLPRWQYKTVTCTFQPAFGGSCVCVASLLHCDTVTAVSLQQHQT